MSSDTGDLGNTTDELPLLVALDSKRVLGDVGAVISGRARPVVMSDSQRAFRWEPDDYDATVIPERFTRPRLERLPDDEAGLQRVHHDLRAEPSEAQPGPAPTRLRPARIISVVVASVLFAVPALLVVALMIALAVR